MAKFDLRTFLSENKLTFNSKILREEEDERDWEGINLSKKISPQAVKKLKKVFKIQTLGQFTQQLKKVLSDPKVLALLRAGTGDGAKDDDKLSYSVKQLDVKELKPTQNVIGFQNSIEPLFTAKFAKSLGTILNPSGGVADVGGPIVTLNGEWIIDGHHRWSQILSGNPEAKVDSLDISAPNMEPKDALKITHAAVAAYTGTVPSTKADNAANVLRQQVTPKYIAKYVQQLGGINPKAKELFSKMGYTSDEAIYKYVADNLKLVKDLGKYGAAKGPDRKAMPQTDKGGDSEEKIAALAKGAINFRSPFLTTTGGQN